MGRTAARTAAAPAAEARAAAEGDAGPGRRTGLTRDDVIAAALDLVEREGAGALTMRRLATELDVGTPTIYWHVGSRDELVVEIVRAQSVRLAEQRITARRPRARVLAAALHIYTGAIEHRAITSLAHQTGTTSLMLHHLEAVLVTELEAAGLTGTACADATRAILVAVTGALVLALRDPAQFPHEHRPDALWAASTESIDPATRAALRREPDVDQLTATTLRAVVDHVVPGS